MGQAADSEAPDALEDEVDVLLVLSELVDVPVLLPDPLAVLVVLERLSVR